MCDNDSVLVEQLKKSILTIVSEKPSDVASFIPEDLSKLLLSLHLIKAFDTAAAQEEIKQLQEALKCQSKDEVATAYKVLLQIFLQSGELFRQKHFHDLMEVYYKQVKIARNKFDLLIKVLLPLVKLAVLQQNLKADLVANLVNFFHNPRLNQEDIYAIVKNKLASADYELESFQLVPLDQRNGHLGDYFQLKITVKHNNQVHLLDLFVKFLGAKMEFFKQLLARGPSKKEEFFYLEYIPKLKQLGLSDLLSFAPECYFSRVDDVLVMEDMNVKGFKGLTPDKKLNLDALKLTIAELAKLHACSLIFEAEQKSNIYDLYSEYLQEVLFVNDPKDSTFRRILDVIVHLCQVFPDIASKYSEDELKQKAQKFEEKVFKLFAKSDQFVNVLCHGDVYVANMLFNFDLKEVCQDVKLIDFQLLRYKPPTHDLMFFLYQNAFKETLDEHLGDLQEFYYATLSGHLEQFKVKAYPKEDFLASMKPMKVLAVFMSFYYSHLLAIDPKVREEVIRENRVELLRDKFYLINLGLKDEHYTRVMRGLVAAFVELCDSNDI